MGSAIGTAKKNNSLPRVGHALHSGKQSRESGYRVLKYSVLQWSLNPTPPYFAHPFVIHS